MRFDTSQQMKLGQQMKLAPRMIQSMEILQMSMQALEERIEQELESNVTLETFEAGVDRETLEKERQEAERADRENERELNVDADSNSADDFERLDAMESSYSEAFDNQYEASSFTRSSDYEPGTYSKARMAGERDAKMDAMANTEARPESLADQLLEQWAFAEVEDDIAEAGKLLIGYIDDDGYIRQSLDEIADTSPRDEHGKPLFAEDTLAAALDVLQHYLDPAGLGARDTRECLLLQLDALAENASQAPGGSKSSLSDEDIERMRTLIADHLDDLVHNRIPQVAKRSGLTIDEIKSATEHMRRLVVNPGRSLVEETSPSIVPDAIVEYDDDSDTYISYLTEGRLPNLRLNREYAMMAKDRQIPKTDREFIRTNLSNAQWLIDAINQRQNTLLRVIKAVVAAQRDFFDMGPQAMKPLPMTQVADQLGIHVATVSRAVAGKHIQTPRGIFPLRKFFTGGTQTDEGEDVSWDAIKVALQEVIEAEDKKKPLSDEAIVKALKEKGIEIARRTVAKYRGQLDIPPARMRREF